MSLFRNLGMLAVLLGMFMFKLRSPPANPATGAEITADGGKFVTQEDGRLIEYFTCGEMNGTPTYFQHGYGNTGKFIYSVPGLCTAAKSLGLFIFSPSMPGFGLSSTYPLDKTRVLAEWPADIELIFNQENIKDFYSAGYSAGGVHALTVANAFSDRILGVGISTPTTPLEVELATNGAMAAPTKFIRVVFVYPYWGDLLGWLMSLVDARGRMAAVPDVAAALNKMEALAKAGDEKWGNALEVILGDQDRGMVKGFRGWADNMAILNEYMAWDTKAFAAKLAAAGKKIIVTSSPDDSTNPPIMQEWWIGELPGAELMQCRSGWGHLHVVDFGVAEELFRRMMGKMGNDKFQIE
jgi:pimeloyl-ACP methyl ester carboxylesterase